MTTAQPRNVSLDFNTGAIDGKYKQVTRDRGGIVELTTQLERDDLDDVWFGIHETAVKRRGDGKDISTAEYQYTKPANPEAI